MRQKIFFFLVSILIIFTVIKPVVAENISKLNLPYRSQLSVRKSTWPNWYLPSFLKRPSLRDDLIYPDWFEGVWEVESKIISDKNEEPIHHVAKFIYNSSGTVIADREYNSQSYALSIKNSGFLSVKNDPNSPNRQFAKLTGKRYLETKIIGRLQEEISKNIFITDELILEILHSPELSGYSQVETLTEFKKCGSDGNTLNKSTNFHICGEQFQAIYDQNDQNLISLPNKAQKFKLFLTKIDYT